MDKIAAAVAELQGIIARTAARQADQAIDDKRRKELETLFAILDTIGVAGAPETTMPAAPVVNATGLAPSVRVGSRKDEILSAVKRELQQRPNQTTRQLVDALAAAGLAVGGKDEVQNLSTYLSRAKDLFRNERGLGWSLTESPHKEVTPQGVTAPEGSDLWNSQPEPSKAPETATGQTQ